MLCLYSKAVQLFVNVYNFNLLSTLTVVCGNIVYNPSKDGLIYVCSFQLKTGCLAVFDMRLRSIEYWLLAWSLMNMLVIWQIIVNSLQAT